MTIRAVYENGVFRPLEPIKLTVGTVVNLQVTEEMPRDRAHDPFSRAILENVEDDVPRLVYADWLEERGDPRGEFIRVQCQLDRLADNDQARPSLLEREQQMIREYRPEWEKELPLIDGIYWKGFHRGFPLGEVDFVNIAFKFSDRVHSNRHAFEYFESLTRAFNEFVDQGNPACMKLGSESIEQDNYGKELLAFAVSLPYLVDVIEINACGVPLSNAVVKALATASHSRTHLRRLDLSCLNGPEDLEPNDEAVEALAGSPRMAYLRELMLAHGGWVITDRGAKALAASPYFGHLTRLGVGVYSDFMSAEGEQVLRARFGDRVAVNWLG